MGNRAGERRTGPKCIAIVGPFGSGKTTLLDAILEKTGTIAKQGSVAAKNTVGDHSPEAREHQMSVEVTVANTEFMGESLTFIDTPGSIEFSTEAACALAGADLAVVVAEADDRKLPALQLILKQLDDLGLPRMIFLNKIDKANQGVRDTLKQLQPASSTPLLLRQIPLWKNGIAVGSIDLALERAYVYQEHAPSEIEEIPNDEKAREVEARFSMLETLADHDDTLMEQLLEDQEPPVDAVFDDMVADLRDGSVTPVLIGAAENGNGVFRLLKAIRHDAPDITVTSKRLAVGTDGGAQVQVLKTIHTPHGGKLSVVRILSGSVSDGQELYGPHGTTSKISGIYSMIGKDTEKRGPGNAGETVALGKLEDAATGQRLSADKEGATVGTVDIAEPVYSVAVTPTERKDEVKLSTALAKLTEEDPSLRVEHRQDSGETVLGGHGEMHLRVVTERLKGKYAIALDTFHPSIPYRETIRKPVTQRGRHKKQSGGHGQFGDVVLEIKPMPRGTGFEFTDTISGGVVPKQYIPSVETGVRDYLNQGPLGFPVVDIAVNLSDGSYHSVDSSDMAFQMAGKLAMREGMPTCSPILLEPIVKIEVVTPTDATAKVTAILSQRRGQILGFDARPGWPGWDLVEAMIPEAEIGDLIIELRSATLGVGSYTSTFDHMAELTGRLADDVLSQQKNQAA